MFPDAWERFRAGAGAAAEDGDLVERYHLLLHDPDPDVRARAARDWWEWETAIVPTSPRHPRYDVADFRLAFARIVTHYWSHGSWLDEGQILRDAVLLAGTPGVIVQGSLDLGNLLGTPWELARAWPGSELVLVDDAGHDARHGGITAAIVEATDALAPSLTQRHSP